MFDRTIKDNTQYSRMLFNANYYIRWLLLLLLFILLKEDDVLIFVLLFCFYIFVQDKVEKTLLRSVFIFFVHL